MPSYFSTTNYYRAILMELIRSTNMWNCALASAAMVLNKPIKELEELIGHNGSEIIHPELKSPGNRKGFHQQEIIDASLVLGFAVTPIEADPVQTPDGINFHKIKFFDFNSSEHRFLSHLNNTVGVLSGETQSGYWHNVAWDGKYIFDPRGKIYKLEDSKIDFKIYWLFTKIKSF
ncbi:MAG: hypothetical protein WC942_04250 [Clostridia bacterium]